jgi:hypothetical protein
MEQEPQPGSEIVLFQTEDGRTRLEVKLENNTVWLSLNQIAELFQRDKSVVSKHIKNVYDERELTSAATVAKFATVQQEGQREVSREIEFYNLEIIIAVGYRVKSQRGTQFRQWATQRLSEYITKGFVLDDERLKNPPGPGVPDYFNELFERIRDIRASSPGSDAEIPALAQEEEMKQRRQALDGSAATVIMSEGHCALHPQWSLASRNIFGSLKEIVELLD